MKPSPFLVAEQIWVRRGTRMILDGVSVGIHPGDRIGVVGRNGGGKSTLLHALAGATLDAGRVTVSGSTRVRLLDQHDSLPFGDVRSVLVGDRPDHEWASDPAIREVLTGLLGGPQAPLLAQGLDTPTAGLSGGESRRVALAATLIGSWDVLMLDEPTNHLDIEAVAWLARHLRGMPKGRRAVVVVTHDRWLLDAVTDDTWEVVDGKVEAYEGGYAAYVLAKAERQRRVRTEDAKRRNLMRKELAWLRRGAPARTSKPKFRMDAAETLIGDEPPPRDPLTLHRVASTRLGKTVLDVENLTLCPAPGLPPVLQQVTWTLGPGDRIGLLGPNGAGKTTLLRLILGIEPPVSTGFVRRGKTVAPAIVDQRLTDSDPEDRVKPWLERTAQHALVTTGKELTTSQLLESFGFTGDAPWKRLGDLSGGERRRLEVLRVLLTGPNVLLLDEPTNDLDIDTLTVLEDVLDNWPGTLVVVSHDRYFLERVCDDIWMMLGDGRFRHAPGGVAEYLRLRSSGAGSAEQAKPPRPGQPPDGQAAGGGTPSDRPAPGSAADRQLRKSLARIERELARTEHTQQQLHVQLAGAATDPDRLITLTGELREQEQHQESLEDEWLDICERLDG